VLVGVAIALAVFLLAQAQVFEPAAAIGQPSTSGDVAAGELVFVSECAGCHGLGGVGGTGTRLAGAALTADEVAGQIRQGSGVMPAGLVEGQEETDVVAYVVSIAGP
jgi:mono/diheme cytochrome c family protein